MFSNPSMQGMSVDHAVFTELNCTVTRDPHLRFARPSDLKPRNPSHMLRGLSVGSRDTSGSWGF